LRREHIVRGATREGAHLDPDIKLQERAVGTIAIGTLTERQVAEVAGRVRSLTINREGGRRELRCVLADASGSINLIFQGRQDIPGIERGTRLLVRGTVTSQNP
jgi:hypothetical protein